jgi:hypothetical protein
MPSVAQRLAASTVKRMLAVEQDLSVQVPSGAHHDHTRVARDGQSIVQAGGQGEVTEVVRGELHLPALGGAHLR